jgi:hypothetical protein
VNLWGNFNELFAVENVWDSKGVESDIQYTWSTRGVIRTTRQAIRQKLLRYSPRKDQPLQVLIDLTSLEKCGKFQSLSAAESWVRWLNEKHGLHVVV